MYLIAKKNAEKEPMPGVCGCSSRVRRCGCQRSPHMHNHSRHTAPRHRVRRAEIGDRRHPRARAHEPAPLPSICILRSQAAHPAHTSHSTHSSLHTGRRHTPRALTALILATTLATCTARTPHLHRKRQTGLDACAMVPDSLLSVRSLDD